MIAVLNFHTPRCTSSKSISVELENIYPGIKCQKVKLEFHPANTINFSSKSENSSDFARTITSRVAMAVPDHNS